MILSLMNEKGGVGKSTLTYSVAWYLARSKQRVLMIDMDGQNANLTALAGVQAEGTMADVLVRNGDWKTYVKPVPAYTREEGALHLLPADTELASLPQTAKISRMKKVLREMDKQYDWIFLDVNPSPDWKHALTLAVVDFVGIVMLPDVLSLEANFGLLESIEEVQESVNPELHVLGVILNGYDVRTNMSRLVAEKTKAWLHTQGLPDDLYLVHKAVGIQTSAANHRGVTEYALKTRIAEDVIGLSRWLSDGVMATMEEEDV